MKQNSPDSLEQKKAKQQNRGKNNSDIDNRHNDGPNRPAT